MKINLEMPGYRLDLIPVAIGAGLGRSNTPPPTAADGALIGPEISPPPNRIGFVGFRYRLVVVGSGRSNVDVPSRIVPAVVGAESNSSTSFVSSVSIGELAVVEGVTALGLAGRPTVRVGGGRGKGGLRVSGETLVDDDSVP